MTKKIEYVQPTKKAILVVNTLILSEMLRIQTLQSI